MNFDVASVLRDAVSFVEATTSLDATPQMTTVDQAIQLLGATSTLAALSEPTRPTSQVIADAAKKALYSLPIGKVPHAKRQLKNSALAKLQPHLVRQSEAHQKQVLGLLDLKRSGKALLQRVEGASHNVYLLPPHIALKNTQDSRADEEEVLTSAFAGLTLNSCFVPSSKLSALSISRFGLPLLTAEQEKEALDIGVLDQQTFDKLATNFSKFKEQFDDQFPPASLHQFALKNPKQIFVVADTTASTAEEKTCYHKFLNRQWWTLYSGERASRLKSISFKRLKEGYYKGLITEKIEIYLPKEEDNFKSLSLMKDQLRPITREEYAQLIKFFTLPSIIIVNEILVKEPVSASDKKLDYAQVQDLIAKPYIPNSGSLFHFHAIADDLLQHLDAENERAACDTSLTQFFDLHPSNITLCLQENEATTAFQFAQFKPPSGSEVRFRGIVAMSFYRKRTSSDDERSTLSLIELAALFQTKRVLDRFEVLYNGRSAALRDIPGLLQALHSPFQLRFFDYDYSIGESNWLQKFAFSEKTGVRTGHIMPLRNALIERVWAKKPLRPATIDALLNSEETVSAMLNFADSSSTGSVFQRMKQDEQKEIQTLYRQMTSGHETSVSAFREKMSSHSTLSDLKNAIAIDLAGEPGFGKFWTIVQQALSTQKWLPYTVDELGSWQQVIKKIAPIYGLTPQHLMELNPTIRQDQLLRVGDRIKVHADITGKSSASEQRRYNLVRQMAPRFTGLQRKAFVERASRRATYLKNYQAVKMLKRQPREEQERILREIVQAESTPFPTSLRQYYIKRLDQAIATSNPRPLAILMDDLEQELTPTFLRVTQSMYPLLCDTMKLYEYVHSQDATLFMPGSDLYGNVHISLEFVLANYFTIIINNDKVLAFDDKVYSYLYEYNDQANQKVLQDLVKAIGNERLGPCKEEVLAIIKILCDPELHHPLFINM